MAQDILWKQYESIQTGLSTELNSLANATLCSVSSAIDQDTPLQSHITLQLDVTFGTNPSAGAYCSIYWVPALDGTNFATSHQDYGPHWLCSIPLRAVTSQQVITVRNVELPPFDGKLALYNASGQSFPASGSTVKYRRHAMQAV